MSERIFPQLSDFRPEELVYMADEHDDEAFALALGEHPAMKAEPGFYEILTGIKDPFANMAFGLRVPDAENRVIAFTNRLRESECPGYFWVGPCTAPENLSEILERNSWTHIASPPAMVIDLNLLKDEILPDGFELKLVKTQEDLLIWQDAMAAGFGVAAEVGRMFSPLFGHSVRLYTAFLNGKVAGTTALICFKGVAGIYSLATLPEFRRQGVGTLLTVLPLLEARTEGYRVGTLQASSMGLPIYQKLGFQEVCKLKMFSFG